MDLKTKIRQARKQATLSQQQLSQAIGVSDKAVSAYEVGRSSPPLKILEKISQATGKPISYFLNKESEAHPDSLLIKLEAIESELRNIRRLLQNDK